MATAGEGNGKLKCSKKCGHCFKEDDNQQVSAFCDVCETHLCHGCYKQHIIAPNEKHQLTEKNQGTQKRNEAENEPDTEQTTAPSIGIYVKSEQCEQSTYSNRPCCITGSAILSDNKMVVCDYSHCMLKCINLEDYSIISEFVLDNHPWSVSRRSDTEVAVTMSYAQTIVFVQMEPSPTLVRVIEVGAECCGVACLQDERLVVTFADKNTVAILDYKGNVLRNFSSDINGQLLFTSPQYITLNAEQNTMYVSNYHTNTVVCITLEGELVNVYKDEDLKGPSQIAIGQDDALYICGHYSQNLHKVTRAGQKVQVQDTKMCVAVSGSDGADRPWSVCYQPATGQLFVGLLGNYIKQYKF